MQLDFSYLVRTFWLCVKAIPVTMEITIVSLLIAFIPALLIALCRIYHIKVLEQIGKIFVSFIRGTPMVLQILIVYSIMPSLLNSFVKRTGLNVNVFDLNPIIYAFVVFGINSTATLSEAFRSAFTAVPRGQIEAALCAVLTPFQTFRRIVFPQAAVSALPNLCSITVILIKNTSLAFMMTVREITGVAKIEAAYGYNYVESYIDIFVIYIFVCLTVELIFRKIEKNLVAKGIRC